MMESSNCELSCKQFRYGSYAGCRAVFAVGTNRRIIGPRRKSLPILTPPVAVAAMQPSERDGTTHDRLSGNHAIGKLAYQVETSDAARSFTERGISHVIIQETQR